MGVRRREITNGKWRGERRREKTTWRRKDLAEMRKKIIKVDWDSVEKYECCIRCLNHDQGWNLKKRGERRQANGWVL